jgi:hypothetical protein
LLTIRPRQRSGDRLSLQSQRRSDIRRNVKGKHQHLGCPDKGGASNGSARKACPLTDFCFSIFGQSTQEASRPSSTWNSIRRERTSPSSPSFLGFPCISERNECKGRW